MTGRAPVTYLLGRREMRQNRLEPSRRRPGLAPPSRLSPPARQPLPWLALSSLPLHSMHCSCSCSCPLTPSSPSKLAYPLSSPNACFLASPTDHRDPALVLFSGDEIKNFVHTRLSTSDRVHHESRPCLSFAGLRPAIHNPLHTTNLRPQQPPTFTSPTTPLSFISHTHLFATSFVYPTASAADQASLPPLPTLICYYPRLSAFSNG